MYEVGIFCVTPGDFGELTWGYSEPGTFFPIPREAGHEAALSYTNSPIDYLIYILLISTGIVYLLPLVSWIITLILSYYIILLHKKRE